jgi:hypothetical protein
VTKSLLGYGVLAGPLYVAVSLSEALTRDGFDFTKHTWSVLANGRYGWVHVLNFAVAGLMTLAFAVGLRRSLRSGVAATWAPRLVAVYGASLVAAGFFKADPTHGFPAGTPADYAEVSWHGLAHLAIGAVGFTALVVACFALARRFAAEHNVRMAAASRAVGTVFALGFAMVAAGGGAAWSLIAFTAAVVLMCGYLSVVAAIRYRLIEDQ